MKALFSGKSSGPAAPPTGRPALGEDDAREALLVLRHHAEADQAPPVLAEEGRLLQVERLDQLGHRVDVELVGVSVHARRLVRTPEADEVGHDAAMARFDENGDHLPEEVRPGRLAVEQQDHFAIDRPLVQVVDAVTIDLHIVWLEVEARQVLEAGVRGAVHARANLLGKGWRRHRRERQGDSGQTRRCDEVSP